MKWWNRKICLSDTNKMYIFWSQREEWSHRRDDGFNEFNESATNAFKSKVLRLADDVPHTLHHARLSASHSFWIQFRFRFRCIHFDSIQLLFVVVLSFSLVGIFMAKVKDLYVSGQWVYIFVFTVFFTGPLLHCCLMRICYFFIIILIKLRYIAAEVFFFYFPSKKGKCYIFLRLRVWKFER